jgi:hypothetical protein
MIEIKKNFVSAGMISILSLVIGCTPNFRKDHNVLIQLLNKSEDSLIQKIYSNKAIHEIQILYTQIQRDSEGNPNFKEFSYQENPKRYFYPASTVKLPVAILALEKVRRLQRQGVGITPYSPFKILDQNHNTISVLDSTHPDGKLTISHLIKKLILVSDNQAYNYLFDFLGRDSINKSLNKKRIYDFQIFHKFSGSTNNNKSPEFVFYSDESKEVYRQPSRAYKIESKKDDFFGMHKGKGFMKEGVLVKAPMDFSKKNYVSLSALNQILKRLIFPNQFPKEESFDLTFEDYEFIKYWMSRTPPEVDVPFYDRDHYYDSYCKFLMYGDLKGEMSDRIRIYNKVGLAYGTLTDVAYIKDDLGVEFLLAATVFVNQNQIFNDGEYEYDDLGIPFLGALGRAVYEYEVLKQSCKTQDKSLSTKPTTLIKYPHLKASLKALLGQ